MNLDAIDFRNGAKSKGLFTAEEMLNRLNNARNLMAENNLDALLITSSENIHYLSGFVRHRIQDLPTLLLILPHQSVLLSLESIGGHNYRNSFCESFLYRDLAHLSIYFGIYLSSVKELGIEAWSLPYGLYVTLLNTLPQMNPPHNSKNIIDTIRKIASAEEQRFYNKARGIVETSFDRGLTILSEGLSEVEMAMEIEKTLLKEASLFFPQTDTSQSYARVQSHLNTDSPLTPSSSRTLQEGDLVNVGVCLAIGNYLYQQTDSFILGTPSASQQLNLGLLKEGYALARTLIRPKTSSQQIISQIKETLKPKLADPSTLKIQLSLPGITTAHDFMLEEQMFITFEIQIAVEDRQHYQMNFYRRRSVLVHH